MSIPGYRARTIADGVVHELGEHCHYVEATGQLRGGRSLVDDIHVLACPRVLRDEMGTEYEPAELAVDALVTSGAWCGVSYDAYDFRAYATMVFMHAHERVNFRVTMIRPAGRWFTALAMTTGSEAYLERLRAHVRAPFAMSDDYELSLCGHACSVDTERSVFNLLKAPYVKPSDRWC